MDIMAAYARRMVGWSASRFHPAGKPAVLRTERGGGGQEAPMVDVQPS